MTLRNVLFGKAVPKTQERGQTIEECSAGYEWANRMGESIIAGIDSSLHRMRENEHHADLARLRQRARHQVERARLLREIERELSFELNYVRNELAHHGR